MELRRRLRVRVMLLVTTALALLTTTFGVLQSAQAAQSIPYKINFQGRLTDNNGNALSDGLYNIKFRILDAATSGTNLWEADRVRGASDYRVQVTGGLFNIQFGDTTLGDPALSPTLFSGTYPLYLEVELPTPATATCATNGCASFTEGAMTPRQPLASSAYAFNSDTLDGLDSGAFGQLTAANNFTGANSFTPASGVGITVRAAAATHSLDVKDSAGTIQAYFDANGILNTAQTIQATTSTVDLGTSGNTFRTGYFGTSVQTPALNALTGGGTITTNAGVLQRTASGGMTIDLKDAGATTLTVTNTGGGVAGISATGGLTIGSGKVITVGATPGAAASCSSGQVLDAIIVTGGVVTGGTCIAAGGGDRLASTWTSQQATTATNTQTTIQFTGAANAAPSFNNGTHILTLPSNASKLTIETKGGGGGGGAVGTAAVIKAAGGGGEGASSQLTLNSLAANYYLKVGAKGTGGAAGGTNNGVAGSSSCLGTNSTDACTAPSASAVGGSGGTAANANGSVAGGVGGLASSGVGDIKVGGAVGGSSSTATIGIFSGFGGGQGGGAALSTTAAGGNAGTSGGGGSGGLQNTALATSRAGGDGGDGYIKITVYTTVAGQGSPTTLQTAYDNSTDPEITLSSSGLTIADSSGGVAGNILEVENSTGSTTYLGVSTTGVTTSGGLTAGGTITAATFSGSGSGLTGLNASSLTTGSGAVTVQAAAGSNASLKTTGAGNITLVTGSASTGVLVQPTTNSTVAFQIQNTLGTSNLLVADTTTTRIGIGTATPGSTLDVNGIANATSYSVGGTAGLSTLSCSGGQVLQNAGITGGILTAGSCVAGGGSYANTTLSNLGATAINASLNPATDLSVSLGTTVLGYNGVFTNTVDASNTIDLNIGTNSSTANVVLGRSGQVLTVSSTQTTFAGFLQVIGGTTANAKVGIGGSLSSNNTSAQYGLQNQISFTPTGASLTTLYALLNLPSIGTSAVNITNVYGAYSRVDTAAGYTGQITTAAAFDVGPSQVLGTKPINNLSGLRVEANTSNAGISGNLASNYGVNITTPSANSTFTTNYGLYIQGTGGGTATNYSLYNASTAESLFAGNITAATFTGSGTNLTNIDPSDFVTASGAATLQAAAGTNLSLTTTGVGTINITAGTGGIVQNLAAGVTSKFTATAAQTADLMTMANTAAFAPTADGINLLQQTFFGKPSGTNMESATRINVTNSNVGAGGQVQGLRIVATGPGGAINSDTDGIYIDALTGGSTGTTGENAIEIGSGWDAGLFVQSGGNTIKATSTTAFVVQNASAVTALTVDTSGNKVAVGSGSTNDTTQLLFNLDTYAASGTNNADTATCTGGTNQGALYYNATSNAIRTCLNAGWEDIMTTAGMGILSFGVVEDSGTNPGDGPGLVSPGVSGPCKVSWASTTTYSIAACTAYSGGRKIIVAAQTGVAVTGMTVTSVWAHICLTGTGGQPALSATATTENATANQPTWNASNPVLCLADIQGTGTGQNISKIYDTRTFTNSQKDYVTIAGTVPGLGQTVITSGSSVTQTPTTASQANIVGVLVALSSAGASTTTPSGIIVTGGPVYVKAGTTTTVGQFLVNSTTNAGYILSNATYSGTLSYGHVRTSATNTCAAAATCLDSAYVNFKGH